jgi:hypothetical protein
MEVGVVGEPFYVGLIGKLQSHFAKALNQFERCDPEQQTVFVCIMALDMEAMLDIDEDAAMTRIVGWARETPDAHPGTGLVMTYQFDWRSPFYEHSVRPDA